LRRLESDDVSAGGIVIPDTAKEKPQHAEVVAVGPGRLSKNGTRIPPEVRKRDRVLIGKYSGTDVTIDGAEFVIVLEDDILGIVGA
jgi:chaperonin GroES